MTADTDEPAALPMYERATRRAALRRGLAAAGVLAAGAWLAACGHDDQEAFASTTTGAAPRSTSAAPSTGRAAPTATTVDAPTTTTAPSADGALPVSVAFSYTASDSSGRVRNPYIAAWVEDASSTMVGVISVWYEARESKYLRELTEFTSAGNAVDSSAFDAVTGATRAAGEYRLQWDGLGIDASALVGPYTLWIEAAREHGPHSVTSGPVTLGAAGTATIPANGELSAAEVTIG